MNKLSAQCFYRGAFGMAFAIMLGAFAAHTLKDKLPVYNLQIFETAVKYQIYGCLGLMILGLIRFQTGEKLHLPVLMLRLGILIFCSTLYFLALRPLLGIQGYGTVGAITPVGGVLMITSWVWTALIFFKISRVKEQ